MTANQSYIYLNIKGVCIWKLKISNKSFGMDIFGAK